MIDAFSRTGTQTACGYAVLPMELIYPEMPENSVYSFTKIGTDAILTFKFGYCNGCRHKLDKWSTLLAYPEINGTESSFVVEITARIGPFLKLCPLP